MKTGSKTRLTLALAPIAVIGCSALIDIQEARLDPDPCNDPANHAMPSCIGAGGAGGAGGSTTTSVASTSSTGGSATVTSATSTSSSTGGGGGSSGCMLGDMQSCMTALNGECAKGTQQCDANGMWLPCQLANVPCNLWAKDVGTADAQYLPAAAANAAGDFFVTGGHFNSVDFGGGALPDPGGGNLFIARLDGAGAHQWASTYGDINQQIGTGIALDSQGNVIVAGFFYGKIDFGGSQIAALDNEDALLAKFDPSGKLLWATRYGNPPPGSIEYFSSVAVDKNDDIIVGGHEASMTNLGMVIAKYPGNCAMNCSPKWVQRASSSSWIDAAHVVVDAAGSVIAVGWFQQDANFGQPIPIASPFGAYVVKYDTQGNLAWVQTIGDGNGGPSLNAVAIDSKANLVATGPAHGSWTFAGTPISSSICALKMDSSGTPVWGYGWGAAAQGSTANAVAIDASDDIVLAGQFVGTLDFGLGALNAGGTDVFLARLDPTGKAQWARQFGDGADQRGVAVSAAPGKGGVIQLVAYGSGLVDFGSGPIVTNGTDILLASFQP